MGTLLSRTKTLVGNAFGLFRIIFKRLAKCLHNHQHRQISCDSTSTKPILEGTGQRMSGNLHSPSIKTPPTVCSVASTSNTHAASQQANFSKLVTSSADEIILAVYSYARPSAREGRSQYPTYRAEGSARQPSVKIKPGTHKSSSPLDDIVQQDNARKYKSARVSGRVTRATTNGSSSETSIPPSDYQKHVEELEKHRITLHRLKREYGKARADCERSENTLQCLRRQGQHTLWVWRKQKNSAEGSLRKMARKLRNARISETEMMIKIDEDEKLLVSKGEKLAAWRRNGKDRWKEVSFESG